MVSDAAQTIDAIQRIVRRISVVGREWSNERSDVCAGDIAHAYTTAMLLPV
jgi:hypothetical protein